MPDEAIKRVDLRTASAEEVNRLMTEAAQAALQAHRAANQSVAVWRDGQVVVLPSSRIELANDPVEIVHRS